MNASWYMTLIADYSV